jgi:hypothetical protein
MLTSVYDDSYQHVFLDYKFTGKERDAQSCLDNRPGI